MDNIDNSQLCETQIVRVGIGGENFGGNISCKFVGGKPSIDFLLVSTFDILEPRFSNKTENPSKDALQKAES